MEITISNFIKKLEGKPLRIKIKLPATTNQLQQAYSTIQTEDDVHYIETYDGFPVIFGDFPSAEQVNLFAYIYIRASSIAKSRLQSYTIRHPNPSCLECINILLQNGAYDINKYSYIEIMLYCTLFSDELLKK